MGRKNFLLLLSLLLGFLPLSIIGVPQAHAQEAVTTTQDATLLPDMPRRLRFTLDVNSSEDDIVEARVFFSPTGTSVRTSERVEVVPARTVDLSHEWNMQQNGVPPGAEIEYFWSVTDSEGNTIETEPESIVALDPRFEWKTIEDEELAIHWYDGDEAWGQEMFDTGKQALAQLEEELGTEIERQVRLVAYASGNDFRGAFPPQQDWIGGQAFPDLGITVQIIGAGDRNWMQTVLFHELSHLVFHQAMEGAIANTPSWLDEGLAMYNEPVSRDSAERVRRAAESGELLPFSHLQGNFGADGPTVGIAYAQSEMLFTYLIEDCGQEGFREFIHYLVDEDLSVDNALENACGYDSETLYSNWRQTLPNAPVPNMTEVEGEAPPAPGTAAPIVEPTGARTLLLAVLAGGLCLVALSVIGIIFIVLRLLRPQRESV
ncbi:MAG: peptidase MA family metallohydrolase [Chloroflexota bacterium]|nr:peptidase MA family metallohydrolase [Chloroflexota bacterium]